MPLRNNRRIINRTDPSSCAAWETETGKETVSAASDIRNESGKKLIFIVGNKENLLHELDQFSVNKASLFPEIDDVAEYIKLKYNGSDK